MQNGWELIAYPVAPNADATEEGEGRIRDALSATLWPEIETLSKDSCPTAAGCLVPAGRTLPLYLWI